MKTVYLERVTCDIPWGFRMVGGCDYGQPIVVHKVSGGSIASGNLIPGDVLLEVMGLGTDTMTHVEAMQAIKSAGTTLQLSLIRTDDEEETPVDPLSFQQQPFQQQQQPLQQQPLEQQPFIPQDSYNPQEAPNNFDFSPVHDAVDVCTEQTPAYSFPAPPGTCPDQQHLTPTNFYNNNGYNNDNNDYNNNSYDNINYDTPSLISPPSPQPEPQQIKSPISPPVDLFPKSSTKPFTYVTDIQDIQAQREKIRKRGLKKNIPAYQKYINKPQNFQSNSPQQDTPDSAVVENLQFNSPLKLYSADNVVDSLEEQTGAEVTGVVGLEEKNPLSIQQSEVYKVIHDLSPIKHSHVPFPVDKEPTHDEATSGVDRTSIYKLSKFGKVNRGNKDPSKSFRRLQNMTGAAPAYENQHQHSKPRSAEPEAPDAESTNF